MINLVALGAGAVLGAGITIALLVIIAYRESSAKQRARAATSSDESRGGTVWSCTACVDEKTFDSLAAAHEHAQSTHRSPSMAATQELLEEVDR